MTERVSDLAVARYERALDAVEPGGYIEIALSHPSHEEGAPPTLVLFRVDAKRKATVLLTPMMPKAQLVAVASIGESAGQGYRAVDRRGNPVKRGGYVLLGAFDYKPGEIAL